MAFVLVILDRAVYKGEEITISYLRRGCGGGLEEAAEEILNHLSLDEQEQGRGGRISRACASASEGVEDVGDWANAGVGGDVADGWSDSIWDTRGTLGMGSRVADGRMDRRARLWARFDFKCTCEACGGAAEAEEGGEEEEEERGEVY